MDFFMMFDARSRIKQTIDSVTHWSVTTRRGGHCRRVISIRQFYLDTKKLKDEEIHRAVFANLGRPLAGGHRANGCLVTALGKFTAMDIK